MRTMTADLVVVGAGPAGLAAARAVRAHGAQVLVLEREPTAGGIPRHCQHPGFGIRDLHRLYSGPSYARSCVELTARTGVEIRTGWTVTEWAGETSVITTSREGRTRIDAGAVLLATGCRERPRSARLVPGARPAGVLTTGALQQLVCSGRVPVGRRAVIVGTEHIAFSALHTLASTGTEVAAVITDSANLETFQLLKIATAGMHRVPVLTGTRLDSIQGQGRVTAASLTDIASGQERQVDCDTVVFTGDWIPANELSRTASLHMDPQTRGPVVDASGRTSTPGVFATGNLVHPAEPADVAAIGGAHTGDAIIQWLRDSSGFDGPTITLVPQKPLSWVTPQLIRRAQRPARDRFLLRAREHASSGHLIISQGPTVLHRQRVVRLVPNRPLTLQAGWLRDVDWSLRAVEISYDPATTAQR